MSFESFLGPIDSFITLFLRMLIEPPAYAWLVFAISSDVLELDLLSSVFYLLKKLLAVSRPACEVLKKLILEALITFSGSISSRPSESSLLMPN